MPARLMPKDSRSRPIMRSRGTAEGSKSNRVALPFDRLYQSALDEVLDQRGMHARARGQHIEGQLLRFAPVKNDVVSLQSHHRPPPSTPGH